MNWDTLSTSPHAVVRAAGVAIRWIWPVLVWIAIEAVLVAVTPPIAPYFWRMIAGFVAIDAIVIVGRWRQYRTWRKLQELQRTRHHVLRLRDALERGQ